MELPMVADLQILKMYIQKIRIYNIANQIVIDCEAKKNQASKLIVELNLGS
jgi:predicted acetyltransferase